MLNSNNNWTQFGTIANLNKNKSFYLRSLVMTNRKTSKCNIYDPAVITKKGNWFPVAKNVLIIVEY